MVGGPQSDCGASGSEEEWEGTAQFSGCRLTSFFSNDLCHRARVSLITLLRAIAAVVLVVAEHVHVYGPTWPHRRSSGLALLRDVAQRRFFFCSIEVRFSFVPTCVCLRIHVAIALTKTFARTLVQLPSVLPSELLFATFAPSQPPFPKRTTFTTPHSCQHIPGTSHGRRCHHPQPAPDDFFFASIWRLSKKGSCSEVHMRKLKHQEVMLRIPCFFPRCLRIIILAAQRNPCLKTKMKSQSKRRILQSTTVWVRMVPVASLTLFLCSASLLLHVPANVLVLSRINLGTFVSSRSNVAAVAANRIFLSARVLIWRCSQTWIQAPKAQRGKRQVQWL